MQMNMVPQQVTQLKRTKKLTSTAIQAGDFSPAKTNVKHHRKIRSFINYKKASMSTAALAFGFERSLDFAESDQSRGIFSFGGGFGNFDLYPGLKKLLFDGFGASSFGGTKGRGEFAFLRPEGKIGGKRLSFFG
jgi:hypothetical protein